MSRFNRFLKRKESKKGNDEYMQREYSIGAYPMHDLWYPEGHKKNVDGINNDIKQ